jgi:hypothetical protein
MMTCRTKIALAAAAMALSPGISSAANAGTRYYYGFDYGYPPAAHDFYIQFAQPYDYYPAYVPVFRFGDIQGLHRLERMR